MKRYLLFVITTLFLFSCTSHYKLLNKNRDTQKIDLGTYKLYQFTMYRDKTSHKDKLINPEFTAIQNGNSTVHEILYLLRDTISNNIIYLTTYSHKYLYRNQGAFNDPIYRKNLVFNDLDHIYLGKESRENDTVGKFTFYSPTGRSYAHNLHIYFTEDEEGLSIDSITNNYAKEKDRIKRPYININKDVFGIKIKFIATNKAYSFYRVEKRERTQDIKKVDSIYVQGTNVFLKLKSYKNERGNAFFRNRLKYFKPY